MQRDLGNEVIVAIAAVGILAFAITFAIILSLSNTPEAIATVTATITSDVGVETQAAPSAVAIASATIATATPTSPATISETISPTTALAVSETLVPTKQVITKEPNTPTQLTQSNSQSATPTEAQESLPTTQTQTRNASATPKQASTRVTPTLRPTATSSFTPSPIPTLTKTPTPIPPTNTPTKTATPSPTATRTPRPTETSGIRPTPTVNITPTAIAFTPGATCVMPQGWVTYVVRQGDTLLKIARAAGSSLFELQTNNCLPDINNIYAGTVIFVPRTPVMSSSPIAGTEPAIPSLYIEGCTDPNAEITNLELGEVVSGVFSVVGTANIPGFWYYKLEVRPDFASVYNFYSRSETPIVNGQLGQIDQSIFGAGIHWIKLTVIGKTSGATPCVIPVIFQ